MTEHVLTIDLGTSGPKVALFTMAGGYVDGDFTPVELKLLPDGGAEQSPAAWWRGIVAAAQRTMARGSVSPDDVAAVAVTSQWSGTVPIDRKGEPLHDAIIWMDARGADDIKRAAGGRVRVQGYDPRKLRTWIKLTGGAPALSGKDPIAHILWLQRTQPALARATWKYLEPKDWINFKLTGRCAATFDSIVLHWITDNRDLARVDYDAGLLRLFGVDRAQFPDLVPATAVLGLLQNNVAAELGVPQGIPVVGGTPDLQSAAIGSGAVARLRGAPLRRHVVVAHVPRSVQEVRHPARRRLAAVAAPRQVLHRRRAGGRGRDPQLVARQRVVPRRCAAAGPSTRRLLPVARRRRHDVARREQRGDLHAVAQRRAHTGRRPPAAGRVAQPVVADHPRRPGALRARRCRVQQPLAARRGREVHRQALPGAQLHRRRCAIAPVVPDHRRRARPPDPPGRASDPRQRPGCSRARRARHSTAPRSTTSPAACRSSRRSDRIRRRTTSTTSSTASSARSTSRRRASTRDCTSMVERNSFGDAAPMREWGVPGAGELDRIVIVSPHLDDAVLGCANFMAAHPGVVVVTVFAGNPPAYPSDPMRKWDVQSGFAPGDDVMETRRHEDAAALDLLDATPVHLEFVEHTYNPGDRPVAPERARRRRSRRRSPRSAPTLVLAPFGLANPDHDVTHRACMLAARAAAATGCRGGATRTRGYKHIPGHARLARVVVVPCGRVADAGLPADRRAARPASARRSRVTRRSSARSRTTGRSAPSSRAPAPEQFWRLAPPPEGWERLSRG